MQISNDRYEPLCKHQVQTQQIVYILWNDSIGASNDLEIFEKGCGSLYRTFVLTLLEEESC